MTLLSALSLSAAMLVLAASPGPGVFATVARSLSCGFRSALGVIAGIVTGDILFLAFALFGLSMVAQVMGEFFLAVRIAGGAYLVWFGLKIGFSSPSGPAGKRPSGGRNWRGNYLGGLAITLSNPKVILFYCGFLPTFLDLNALRLADMALVAGIVTTILSAVLAVYALLASTARTLFSDTRSVRRLNRAAGCVMIATGVTIATRS